MICLDVYISLKHIYFLDWDELEEKARKGKYKSIHGEIDWSWLYAYFF